MKKGGSRLHRWWFFWAIGLMAGLGTLAAGEFRAAVVKVDITPEEPQMLLGYAARKSTGVHDRIYHRVVVLDDGVSRFYLVSSDICLISPSEYDRVARKLQERRGVAPRQFWWTATHTHSAPEVGPPGLLGTFLANRYTHTYDQAYADEVAEKLVAGVEAAEAKLQPARLGVGWGHSRANINRRARDEKDETFLGLNPDEPVDRRIGLLKIVSRENDHPLVLLANYAMHATVLGGANLLISADAPGVVSEYVEKEWGAPLVYLNGAAGNIAPLYSVYPTPQAGKLHQFKRLLGDRILEATQNVNQYVDAISLRFGEQVLSTPRKADLGWPEDLGAYTHRTEAGVDLIRLPIRFLRLNDDIALWGAPLELFTEIASEVRERSPFPYTFYVGYTNGWLGYMLTEREYAYGGYEVRVSPYTPRAGTEFREVVSAYLEGELRRR